MAEWCVNAEYKLKFDPRREDQRNLNDNTVQHFTPLFTKFVLKLLCLLDFRKNKRKALAPRSIIEVLYLRL